MPRVWNSRVSWRIIPFVEAPSSLTFAVVSGAKAAAQHLESLAGALAKRLERPTTGRVLANYDELSRAVADGAAQIVWAPPRLARDLHRAGHATVALGCTRAGALGYHAALFTKHTSTIETLADLRGKHVAWVHEQSSAGYVVPRRLLARSGLDPETLFSKESFLGTHQAVAVAVLSGEVDAGATFVSLDPQTSRPLSAGWLEAGAAINGAFIIAMAGPIPPDAIVLSNRLDEGVRARIATELAAVARVVPEAIGGLFGADGLAPADVTTFEVEP